MRWIVLICSTISALTAAYILTSIDRPPNADPQESHLATLLDASDAIMRSRHIGESTASATAERAETLKRIFEGKAELSLEKQMPR